MKEFYLKVERHDITFERDWRSLGELAVITDSLSAASVIVQRMAFERYAQNV